MTLDVQAPLLRELEFLPYCDDHGRLPQQFSKAVGIYAIYDAEKTLQFVGYSRDITMSLKQHLVRCPHACHWVKVTTIERPNRTLLETIQSAWLAESGTPIGGDIDQTRWTEPIDVKGQMTPDEQDRYQAAVTEIEQAKCLKKIAQRVEADLLALLKTRGICEPLRFDPKLKEQGLLNIKP